jgi:hypothetical protein
MRTEETTTHDPERRRRRAGFIVLPAALLASSVVVWRASYAAFSATTNNGVNNWQAGSVSLKDDDNGVAMFNALNIKPGDTGTNCIAVTYTGSLAGSVKLYMQGYATTNALANNMTVTVDQGTGGGFGTCAGFAADAGGPIYTGSLANLAATRTNFANGAGTFGVTGTPPESKVYRFVWTLNAAAPSSVQGGTAQGTFVWEVQNA